MKIKRILLLVLSLVLLIPMLMFPASARTKSDLDRVYNNLTRYFYAPFYNDSHYYEAFDTELNKAGELLKKDNATNDEIRTQYDALQRAYAALVRDSFDYSVLEQMTLDYESLDLSLFDEESWRKLSAAMENIYTELNGPTLFEKGNKSKEEFAEKIASFLVQYTKAFESAYNNLILLPLTETMTVDQLTAFINYCDISAKENVMGGSVSWSAYQSARKNAEGILAERRPSETKMAQAAASLLEAYKALEKESLDYSPIHEELTKYRALSKYDFTQNSWKRYETEIEILNEKLTQTYFFYLHHGKNEEESIQDIKNYFASMTSAAKVSHDELVTQESVNKLAALCNTYKNTSAEEGLKNPVEKLHESVTKGLEILANPDATQTEVSEACAEIEERAENLQREAQYLEDNAKKSKQKNDVTTIQEIVIYTAASLILSFAFAIFASLKQYGRLDWTR